MQQRARGVDDNEVVSVRQKGAWDASRTNAVKCVRGAGGALLCCPSRYRPTSPAVNCDEPFQALQLHLRYLHEPAKRGIGIGASPRGVRQRASNKSADTHCLLAPPHREPTIKFSPVHLSAPTHSPPDCRVVPLRCGRCGRQAYETSASGIYKTISGSPSTHARRRHSPAASVATTRRGPYIIVAR
jgi:hypothetical protein